MPKRPLPPSMAVLLAVILALAACAPASPADATATPTTTVRVAAAADLRFAFEELVESWQAASPEIAIETVYGSSGTFFAQISQGAPFDLYFSADVAYPRELEAAGLAEPGSTRVYGIGQIVVWVLDASPIDVERGLAALAEPSVRRVAIANPEHAPYGRAASDAIETAGLTAALESKLVLGENVAQAAQFAESGNADAGIVALSLALAPALADTGRHSIVPIDTYPTLEQGAVVLSAARDPAAAEAFVDFVLAPGGRAVLDRFGFLAPPALDR